MKFKSFSRQQTILLNWWCQQSPLSYHDAVIADGAVRSGKTICMSISFISWAMSAFRGGTFAICGKTVTSLRRNVITLMLEVLPELGFRLDEKLSKGYIDIYYQNCSNRFYLFGGKDEGSAALIQGITLCGIMLDEVALMPRSFVEQALARCSVDGSKFWFNCNPEHPFHWFYLEWIKKAKQKNALYLHFKMEDNPSLTSQILERYQSLYSGTFFERFVLGKWVQAQGVVYPMFSEQNHVVQALPPVQFEQWYVSCDYGTINPTSMGLWGLYHNIWYRVSEYYYASRTHLMSKTDEEYYQALLELVGGRTLEAVVIDPSAASFTECIRRHGKFKVIPAKNEVLTGIHRVSEALKDCKIQFHASCIDTLREFSCYCWEENNRGDTPKKEHDHAMDDIRYFVSTVMCKREDDFCVISTSRL